MRDGIRRVIFLLPILLSACSNPDPGGPAESGVPSFAVDPGWPREMPNLWIMGSITGVFVDARDHVWVTHIPESLTPEETSAVQDPPIGTCCVPAPVVTEFDPEGNLVQGWGDPPRRTSRNSRATRTASSSTTTTTCGWAPTGTTGS